MKKYNVNSGWKNESARHSLASKGIKTGRKVDYMYGLETIRQMNREQAKKAQGKSPLLYDGVPEDLRHIPNFGDYRPKGWKLVKTYFVDSSGFGQSGEGALTFDEFVRQAKKGKGYAIIEAGQFQVYIGEFEKKTDFAQFGILQPSGKVVKSMSIDVNKVKSPDPLAYSYGYFQAQSGQPMSKDKGLAPEYIRGYKDAKAGKKL
jgi:hypothetical protein